jgi:hypothetical protein
MKDVFHYNTSSIHGAYRNPKFRNADLHAWTMHLEGMSKICVDVLLVQTESEVRTGDSLRPDTQKKKKKNKMVTVV